jgi:hypothetical protein
VRNVQALKGRHNGVEEPTFLFRPFRAQTSFELLPRALPWAGLLQASGLPERLNAFFYR